MATDFESLPIELPPQQQTPEVDAVVPKEKEEVEVATKKRKQ